METEMKKAYRMFRRSNGVFYLQNNQTLEQTSLKTKDKDEATKLLNVRNDLRDQSALNRELGKVYLRAADPEMAERTWEAAMALMCERGKESTRARCKREMASKAFSFIRTKRIVETTAEDLKAVLKRGGAATNHYLRRLHNLALDHGFLFGPIIPPKQWDKPRKQPKRAVTFQEFSKILEAEQHPERRQYYRMLWLTGSAQTDCSLLTAEHVNHASSALVYQRRKTGQWCKLALSTELKTLLAELPQKGLLFPYMASLSDNDRAAEFSRRCRLLGIKGISLHSFRYAWAERAYAAGYPERFAQAALGHSSRAVHNAYARKADFVCPPLENNGADVIPFAVAVTSFDRKSA